MIGAFACIVALDRRSEAGYVAFNAGRYAEARARLRLNAQLGDERAQSLMAYMSGLGLDGPVDFAESIAWMVRISAARGSGLREQAFYLGRDATSGLYGGDKKELGYVWLRIAHLSGSQEAGRLLSLGAAETSSSR